MATVTLDKTESQSSAARLLELRITAPTIVIWLVAIGWGFFQLSEYKSTEGDPGSPPQQWPSELPLPAPAARPTMLFFSHPHCPCTRASFRALERILADSANPIDLQVIFVGEGFASQPGKSVSHMSAASTLDPNVIAYDNGDIAKRFGVKTSSHILLYDMHGRLQFSGGINPSRGHEGDSAGGSALAALLQNRATDTRATPVFGCPLFSSGRSRQLPVCEEAITGK